MFGSLSICQFVGSYSFLLSNNPNMEPIFFNLFLFCTKHDPNMKSRISNRRSSPFFLPRCCRWLAKIGMRRRSDLSLWRLVSPPRLDSSPVVSDWPERDDWLRAWTGGNEKVPGFRWLVTKNYGTCPWKKLTWHWKKQQSPSENRRYIFKCVWFSIEHVHLPTSVLTCLLLFSGN